MSVQGLDEFSRDLDPVPFLQRAATTLQRAIYEDLRAGNFDISLGDPEKIQHNRPYTIRRKGFDAPGFGTTGEMSLGLVDPSNVRIDGNEVALDLFAPRGQELKFNVFTRGQTQPRRVVVLTGKDGKARKRVEREVVVPPRDFVQARDEPLDAIGEDVINEIGRQWGFVDR